MRERARQLVELHVDDSADWPLAQLSIAQALADEFARGAASALDNLELHQITDAACKRATADGLEITIRVKQLANPKKSKKTRRTR
jgi:hypothetical protein